jgi:cytochrome c oxidase subunit II
VRTRPRAAATASIACLAIAAASCSGNQSMFNPQGPAATSIASLGWLMFAVCGVIYLIVLALLAWALARRRHVRDDLPQTSRRLAALVSAGVAVSAVILVLFVAASVAAGRGFITPAGAGAITVDVIGHQWWWDFQYRDVSPQDVVTSPNELHIPVGVPVVVNAVSRDVIHSFWVPNLHGKRDLIPGQVTRTWIQADAPGVYRGQCAEFCGHQHAHMAFTVVAEPMDEFQRWIRQQRRAADEPANDEQRRGRDLFLGTTCATCHTIRGTSAGSRVGPELTHVGSRLTIAAGTLPNTRDHLTRWVLDPQAIKPGVRMPPHTNLSPADLGAVISYLRSLR